MWHLAAERFLLCFPFFCVSLSFVSPFRSPGLLDIQLRQLLYIQPVSRADFLEESRTSKQTKEDPCDLLADARHVKPVYDAFIAAVASKSGGQALHTTIKGRYRIGEKIVLRSHAEKKRYPGACGVRDAVRGAIVYSRMTELVAGFEMIVDCDVQTPEEIYTAAEAAGLTTLIVMRGNLWAWWVQHLFVYM